MPLTDSAVRNAKPSSKPCKLTDSHGLFVEIKPNGKKYWRYRYRIGGKENLFAIGEFRGNKSDPNHVSLADARSLRDEAKKLVKQGVHPSHHRKAQIATQIESNQNTFKSLALSWHKETMKKKGWTERYAAQVKKLFEEDAFPVFGDMPIQYVTADHVATLLERFEKRDVSTTAILARQWCSAVFRYAIRRRRAEHDPTTAFKGEIRRPPVEHSKPLPLEEIPAFLQQLRGYQGKLETVIALRLLMLTMVRTKELREAKWHEFDFENAIWRIPAERMKMRREHLVPLSSQAVELLKDLYPLTAHLGWLFPNSRTPEKPMTATTLNRALEYMGYAGKFSCHGFRSTASTILNEKGYRSDVVERALAHADKNSIRKAYNQAQYLEERRQMLQDWADFLDGLEAGAKVIPLRSNRGA